MTVYFLSCFVESLENSFKLFKIVTQVDLLRRNIYEYKYKKYSILNDKVVKTLLSKNESFTKEYMCRIIHESSDIPLADLRRDLTLIHPSIPVKQDVVGSETDILYQTKDYYIDIEVNYRYSRVVRKPLKRG